MKSELLLLAVEPKVYALQTYFLTYPRTEGVTLTRRSNPR